MIFIIFRPVFMFCNLIYLIFTWIFSVIRYKKPSNIPPITNPLLMISATELAKKIRERKCTSYEVILAYIERIKEVNPYINAVVENRYKDALAEAKSCDLSLEAGNVDIVTLKKQKPFYGVPFSVKESCPVKGFSNTGCSLAYKGRKAAADSVVVKRLRDAGAIVLCITNTPEMCGSLDTYNIIYGRSYNPYDIRYTSGGSSGGEAALLGAGASLIGIGSDLGGSIRVPALFCGIFGFKPTSEIIPSRDHFPTNDNENFNKYITFGPMARYADDLHLFMTVASTKSDIDLCLDEPVDWKQTTIYYQENLSKSMFSNLSVLPEIKQCVLKAADYFSGRGVNTRQIPIEWPSSLYEMLLSMYMNVGMLNVIVDNSKHQQNPIVELMKYMFGLSNHTLSLLFFGILIQLSYLSRTKKKLHYRLELKKFQEKLQKLLGKNGLLIYPTFRVTAIFPELIYGEYGNSMIYSALANVLGFPAIHIPIGFNSKGLPIGVQIMAAPYQDRLCLAAAKELEIAFGGWVPPSTSINN